MNDLDGQRVFVIDRGLVLPAILLNTGLVWTRVVIFKPFDGTKVKRKLNRNVLSVELGQKYLAWKRDPMADVPPFPVSDQSAA